MQVSSPSRLLACAVVAAFPLLVPMGSAALAAQDSGQAQPAQDEAQWEVAPRLWAGGGLTVAQPRGEFADYVAEDAPRSWWTWEPPTTPMAGAST